MRHLSTDSNIMAGQVELGFQEIYQKPYIAAEYLEEIKKANLLVLPSENIRENLEPVFPELTFEFYQYLKEHAPENVCVDIAVDDEHFHKLVLHTAPVALATLIIREEIVADTFDLIVGFLKTLAQKNNRFEDEMDTFVNILVDTNERGCIKIMYRGRVSELRESLDKILDQLFNGVEE